MKTVENRNNVTYLSSFYGGRVSIDGTSALDLNRGDGIIEASLPIIRLPEIDLGEFLDSEDGLPKIYFDVRKFSVEDLIRILAECRRTEELSKRISVFELRFDKDGNPLQKKDDGSCVKMRENVKSKLDLQEVFAMQRIRELYLLGHKTIAWFSPNGGNSQYVENRITVAVLKDIEESGSMVFECRGICTQHGREDFYNRVRKIVDGSSFAGREIKDPDDLRENPIPVDSIGSLAKIFNDIPEVFEAIATGKDVENMEYLRGVALAIKAEWVSRERKPVSFIEAVEEGAYLERVIRERFKIDLMPGGGHGSSNEKILGDASGRLVTKDTPGAKLCLDCGAYYVGNDCPVCGK